MILRIAARVPSGEGATFRYVPGSPAVPNTFPVWSYQVSCWSDAALRWKTKVPLSETEKPLPSNTGSVMIAADPVSSTRPGSNRWAVKASSRTKSK